MIILCPWSKVKEKSFPEKNQDFFGSECGIKTGSCHSSWDVFLSSKM
jgi:hypothetical protein